MSNTGKCRIRKGDTVKVIAGEDKGKTGRVLQVIPETGRALVEGVRVVKKHTRKSESHPHGGVVSMEAPLDISNLRLSE